MSKKICLSNVVFGWRLQSPTVYHQKLLRVPASAADNALLDSPSLVVLGVSGMRDNGCETLPVIGWWYWESVGCETMGVRHCLLLAGGIGSQWDARQWV